jgi:hypothetical protein
MEGAVEMGIAILQALLANRTHPSGNRKVLKARLAKSQEAEKVQTDTSEERSCNGETIDYPVRLLEPAQRTRRDTAKRNLGKVVSIIAPRHKSSLTFSCAMRWSILMPGGVTTLARIGKDVKIRERRAIVDNEPPRPHGKISFCLIAVEQSCNVLRCRCEYIYRRHLNQGPSEPDDLKTMAQSGRL